MYKTEPLCKVCSHPLREVIDSRIRAGESGKKVSEWLLSEGLKISDSAITRHRKNHLGLEGKLVLEVTQVKPTDFSNENPVMSSEPYGSEAWVNDGIKQAISLSLQSLLLRLQQDLKGEFKAPTEHVRNFVSLHAIFDELVRGEAVEEAEKSIDDLLEECPKDQQQTLLDYLDRLKGGLV